jgi:hypothetical protein
MFVTVFLALLGTPGSVILAIRRRIDLNFTSDTGRPLGKGNKFSNGETYAQSKHLGSRGAVFDNHINTRLRSIVR